MDDTTTRAEDRGTPEAITWESLGLPLRGWQLGDPALPPAVFLHGFLDQGRSFLPCARRLTQRFRVIMPDHRGHGASAHVGQGGYYHFPDYVLDLAALLDHLGLDEVALIGHSMGASIAAYFAGAFPARVAALALLDALGPAHQPPSRAPRAMASWIRDAQLARRRPEPAMDDLEHVVARLRRSAPGASEEVLRELAGYAAEPDGEGRLRWRFDPLHRTRAPIPFDEARFAAFLSAVECPTVIVWGEASPFRVPALEARARYLRDAVTYTVAGAGHNLHHERPAELAAVLLGFLVGVWDER